MTTDWSKRPLPQKLDPAERYIPLILKLCVYCFLTFFFFQAATSFIIYHPGQYWPGLLSVVRTFIFLPLHEGGHFLFMFFGRTLYILGGSFWQVMFPLLWFLIALKQRSQVAPFALFWVGENLMDVSLYIRDAAYRALPLLGGDSSGHDWYNLLSDWNAVDSADTIGDIVYYGGFAISVGAIVTGIVWAFVVFSRSLYTPIAEMQTSLPSTAKLEVEERLNTLFAPKKKKNDSE